MHSAADSQAAYILHRRPFKESSFILDIFSLNFGRLSLVAKGAQTSRQYQAAQLQVFQPLLLSWRGRSELKTLSAVEVPSRSMMLTGQALYCGYYLNELLLLLTAEQDPNPELFSCYAESLQKLVDDDEIEPCLRRFELNLLVQLGLAPDFSADDAGQAIQSANTYYLSNEGRFVIGSSHHGNKAQLISGSSLQLLASGWQHTTLLNQTEQREAILRECKRLMRTLIDHALAGRTIKSRALFRQLKEGIK